MGLKFKFRNQNENQKHSFVTTFVSCKLNISVKVRATRIILLASLLNGLNISIKAQGYYEKTNAKGCIISIRETSYKAIDSSTKGQRLRPPQEFDTYNLYNEKGYPIDEKDFESNDTVVNHYTYQYDERDNLIDKKRYFRNKGLYQWIIFSYNNNKLIEKKFYEEGKLQYHTFNTYNDSGKLVEEKTLNQYHEIIPKLTSPETYEYDSLGKMVRETVNYLNGDPYYDLTYFYIDGQLVEENYDYYGGTMVTNRKHTYNNKKQLIETIEKLPDGINGGIYKSIFNYSNDGLLVNEEKLIDFYINSDDSTPTFLPISKIYYEYDYKGNWVRKIIFECDYFEEFPGKIKPVFIVERLVIYCD